MFGQTVTMSGDITAQYSRHADASPSKYVMWDAETEGSGGVLPYRYRETSFVNTLQWAVGLELFLLAEAPERLFFTTDHPNGAPFTAYPELLRLLMDADYRQQCSDSLAEHNLSDIHGDIRMSIKGFQQASRCRRKAFGSFFAISVKLHMRQVHRRALRCFHRRDDGVHITWHAKVIAMYMRWMQYA
jgi:hypothetical protein